MANMASVAYAIEGPREELNEILGVICLAMADKEHWEEYTACRHLGFTEEELENYRLGGEISEEPEIVDGVLRFWAEERWGLQDFEMLLRKRFPDIKVYWVVEEPSCEVYATNDKEGKYFPERYWVDTAIDDIYQSEYFMYKSSAFKWLHDITNGEVHSEETLKKWNSRHEDVCDDDENFITIHEFEVVD